MRSECEKGTKLPKKSLIMVPVYNYYSVNYLNLKNRLQKFLRKKVQLNLY